jgi:hypothetical protein
MLVLDAGNKRYNRGLLRHLLSEPQNRATVNTSGQLNFNKANSPEFPQDFSEKQQLERTIFSIYSPYRSNHVGDYCLKGQRKPSQLWLQCKLDTVQRVYDVRQKGERVDGQRIIEWSSAKTED